MKRLLLTSVAWSPFLWAIAQTMPGAEPDGFYGAADYDY
jgi:hypothetical protein